MSTPTKGLGREAAADPIPDQKSKRIARENPNDALEVWEVFLLLRAAGLVAGLAQFRWRWSQSR